MTANNSHPVWELYDCLKTVRLNVEYYVAKAHRVRNLNRNLDILLAVVVPTSAAAALPVWQTSIGIYVWATLFGLAAFVAVAKPFLKLVDKLQQYESTVARYRMLEGDLTELKADIVQQQSYPKSTQVRFRLVMQSLRRAIEAEPIDPTDDPLMESLYEKINKELPADRFYVPTN